MNKWRKYSVMTFLPCNTNVSTVTSVYIPQAPHSFSTYFLNTKFGFGNIPKIYCEISLLHTYLRKHFYIISVLWTFQTLESGGKVEQRHQFHITCWETGMCLSVWFQAWWCGRIRWTSSSSSSTRRVSAHCCRQGRSRLVSVRVTQATAPSSHCSAPGHCPTSLRTRWPAFAVELDNLEEIKPRRGKSQVRLYSLLSAWALCTEQALKCIKQMASAF